MSCNGCRVLRKGCSENCSIRPCLQWIKSPESQAHATVFLAKFYGRAGLMNLINSGPDHLRPAIFRSLLYESCGRIVNPIYGSVGLLWSNNWHLCQAAVDAVLNGEPVTQISSDKLSTLDINIRHVGRDIGDKLEAENNRTERSGKRELESEPDRVSKRAKSHESSGSHLTEHENESMATVETVDGSRVSRVQAEVDDGELDLELTLGFQQVRSEPRCELVDDTCRTGLRLEFV